MSRLERMEYTADFLRGWPNEGALESSTYSVGAAHLVEGAELEAGDMVTLDTDGTLIKATGEVSLAGIIVRGNGDDKSSVASGKAIVLWGGYIVRTTKVDAGVMGLNPMDPVNAGTGIDPDGVGPLVAPEGIVIPATAATAADAVLGFVLEVIPGVNGNPDSAVIVVR